MNVQVMKNPNGQLLIAAASTRRWAAVSQRPPFNDVSLVASFPMIQNPARKMVRVLMRYYESQGLEIIWPKINGIFAAINDATGDVIATGDRKALSELFQIDNRSMFRSQSMLICIKGTEGVRIRFEPIDA